jgi:hypothetical protein
VVDQEHYVTITSVDGEGTYFQIWQVNKSAFDWVQENVRRVLGAPHQEGLSSLKSANAGAEAMFENGLVLKEGNGN